MLKLACLGTLVLASCAESPQGPVNGFQPNPNGQLAGQPGVMPNHFNQPGMMPNPMMPNQYTHNGWMPNQVAPYPGMSAQAWALVNPNMGSCFPVASPGVITSVRTTRRSTRVRVKYVTRQVRDASCGCLVWRAIPESEADATSVAVTETSIKKEADGLVPFTLDESHTNRPNVKVAATSTTPTQPSEKPAAPTSAVAGVSTEAPKPAAPATLPAATAPSAPVADANTTTPTAPAAPVEAPAEDVVDMNLPPLATYKLLGKDAEALYERLAVEPAVEEKKLNPKNPLSRKIVTKVKTAQHIECTYFKEPKKDATYSCELNLKLTAENGIAAGELLPYPAPGKTASPEISLMAAYPKEEKDMKSLSIPGNGAQEAYWFLFSSELATDRLSSSNIYAKLPGTAIESHVDEDQIIKALVKVSKHLKCYQTTNVVNTEGKDANVTKCHVKINPMIGTAIEQTP